MLLFATVLTVAAKQNTLVAPSIGPASTTGNSNNLNPFNTLRDKTVYAWAFNGMTAGPISFDLAAPGSATSIKASSTTPFAGTWINNIWYVITYAATCQLVTVDPTTGTETIIGSTGILGGTTNVPMGMAYDDKTGITYATWTPYAGGKTMFYTIDLTTGATTHIGDIATQVFIDWACDSNGVFYGEDMTSHNLYLIDPTVPSDTLIGPLGISIAYAQGAAFDKDTNILYLAAYTTSGALYTCDTTTGHATLVGAFPSSAEVDAFAIPYSSNQPPETPATPTGPDTGLKGVEYTFSAITTDPEGDQVFYMFDWGDGTNSTWVGPYNSGVAGSAKHTYAGVGTFSILAKAKDINGGESAWSAAHTITISEGAPAITIQGLTGGLFKVKATIKNTGTLAATNIKWNITLTGGAFIGKESSGTITSLAAGATQDVSSKFILGFGKTVVTVTASIPESSDTLEQNGTILLFFIKL
jgi:hypothetical protein